MGRQLLVTFLLIAALQFFLAVPLGQAAQTCVKPEGFPTRNIEWVVRYGVGGGSDQFARALKPLLESQWGVSLVVINMPGGGGVPALTYFLNKPADGYTLYGVGNGLAIQEALNRSQFTRDDVIYLMRGNNTVEMIFSRTDNPRFQSWDDVVREARAEPGKVSVAIAGLGGIDEVIMSLISDEAGLDFKLVPYSKPSERYAAFLGGHTDLMFEEPGDVRVSVIDPEKGKPLIVFTEKRIPGFEDAPTGREKGIDVTMSRWRGLALKAGTDPAVVKYLECTTKNALESQEYQAWERKKWLHLRPAWAGSKELTDLVNENYGLYHSTLKKLGYEVKEQ